MASDNNAPSSLDLARSWAGGEAVSVGGGSEDSNSHLNMDASDSEEAQDGEIGFSTDASDLEASAEAPASSDDKGSKAAAAPAGGDAHHETITVKGPNGSRTTLEVDYQNREAIKKAYLMAHGARQWQTARDETTKKLTQLDSEHKALRTNWDALEGAFRNKGVEGVVDLLEGSEGSYRTHLEREMKKAEFMRNASPAERKALEEGERATAASRELEKIREENKKFREDIEKERETAETRNLESKIHPNFEKYRFKGKLGDAADEHTFDEMLWNSALRRLEPFEEQGLDITPEMVEREFRTVAQTLRKRIAGYGEKVASRTIENKKERATQEVQSKIISGQQPGDARKEAMDMISNGNLAGVFKNWGRLGGAFSGNAKKK